jgi:hypothetical protein
MFTLAFKIDNDAFQPEPFSEVAHLLHIVAVKVSEGQTSGKDC